MIHSSTELGSTSHPRKALSTSSTADTLGASSSWTRLMSKLHILDELSQSMHNTQQQSAYPGQTTSDQQTSWIVTETQRTIASLAKGSDLFINHPPKAIPTFEEHEVQLGQMIGNGQFGIVFEVTGFNPNKHIQQPKSTKMSSPTVGGIKYEYEDFRDCDQFPYLLNNEETKTYMRENFLRDGAPRFAVKRVRLDLVDERKGNSVIDLAVESKILATIDHHSNIVKLRGLVSQPGYDSFMIVLDRLYTILDKTIQQWKDQVRATRGPFGLRVFRRVDHYKVKTERLVCAFDIARALKHLHSLKILYRDLKPE
jgi:serine/threonine protein kinase